MPGDLSLIDEFSMEDRGYLILEVEEQYGEILSEVATFDAPVPN